MCYNSDRYDQLYRRVVIACFRGACRGCGISSFDWCGKDQARQKAVEGETTCYDLSKDCYCSPLGHAISLWRTEICRLLLKFGAAVNGPGGKIEPPLHIAIRYGKGRPLVPLLIKAGADLNLKFKNVRPLALAVAHTHLLAVFGRRPFNRQ